MFTLKFVSTAKRATYSITVCAELFLLRGPRQVIHRMIRFPPFMDHAPLYLYKNRGPTKKYRSSFLVTKDDECFGANAQ